MEVLPGFSPALVLFFIWLHMLRGTLFQGDYQLRVIPLFFHGSLMFLCWLPWGESWESVSLLPGCGRHLLCRM